MTRFSARAFFLILIAFVVTFCATSEGVATPQLVTAQNSGTEIHLSNIDGTEDQVLVEEYSPFTYALYLSGSEEKLFFGTFYGGVYSVNLDGSNFQKIFAQDYWNLGPAVVAVDTTAAKLYYSTDGGPISRADLNGQNVEVLIASSAVNNCRAIRLDSDEQKIYWADGSGVSRANLDGSAIETIIDGSQFISGFGYTLAVDLVADKLYFSAYPSSASGVGATIYSANLDGTSLTPLISFPNASVASNYVYHLEVDHNTNRIYWECPFGFSGGLCAANLDGSNPQVIDQSFLGTDSGSSFAVDARTDQVAVYFGVHGGEQSVVRRFIGSAAETQERLARSDMRLVDLALDNDLEKFDIYWTDSSRNAIMKLSPPAELPEEVVSGLPNPRGLFLDKDRGALYWTDGTEGKLHRAKIDGSQVEDLVSGLEATEQLSIDLTRNVGYSAGFDSSSSGVVQSFKLDSGTIRTIARSPNLVPSVLASDPSANYFYVGTNDGQILRFDPRSKRQKEIARTATETACFRFSCADVPAIPTAIIPLHAAKLLYWGLNWSVQTEKGSLFQAKQDGSGQQALFFPKNLDRLQFTSFVQDEVPPVLSKISVSRRSNKFTFKWTTNEKTDAAIEFGATPDLGGLIYESGSRTKPKTKHKVVVAIPKSVSVGATYYFRLRSRDAYGNLTVSEILPNLR